MRNWTRRDVLRMGIALATGVGLSESYGRAFAKGLGEILSEQTKVLWLQGQSCSGCSVSFLNSQEPDLALVLTEMISLVFHSTVSAAQGEPAMELIDQVAEAGNFLLVIEGSLPQGMPEACVIGGRPLTSLLRPLLRKAKGIVAAGTCAAYGGIPAAEGNPTMAVGVREFMEREGIPVAKRLINCPGCPVHPQSLVGTLAYVAARGYPRVLPKLLAPEMFYGSSVHDECPMFHHWEKQHFAEKFGDEGCLFKLGCLGPLSRTNCPRRQWNGGVNWCIRAGAPCIACTSESFARKKDFPFYRIGEQYHMVTYKESDRIGTET